MGAQLLLVLVSLIFAGPTGAIEIQNRPLVPTSASIARTPAEAGLESGRYEEIPLEKLESWERRRSTAEEKSAEQKTPAKVESNFQKTAPTR